jgi:hypothetical protein
MGKRAVVKRTGIGAMNSHGQNRTGQTKKISANHIRDVVLREMQANRQRQNGLSFLKIY